jgi:hypothetical protein
MKNKYFFNNEDITTDLLFKIEHIVNILSEKKQAEFDDMYAAFISSNTYQILKRTGNLYWAESAEFIADDFFREKTGENVNF